MCRIWKGWQYQRSARKEEVVTGIAEAQQGGIYDAPVASVRHVSLPTNEVEVSAVITEQSVSHEAPVVTTVNLKPGMFAQASPGARSEGVAAARSYAVAPGTVVQQCGEAMLLQEPQIGSGTITYSAPVTGYGVAAAPSTFCGAATCGTAWGAGDVSGASTARTTRSARGDAQVVTEPVAGTINTQSTLMTQPLHYS